MRASIAAVLALVLSLAGISTAAAQPQNSFPIATTPFDGSEIVVGYQGTPAATKGFTPAQLGGALLTTPNTWAQPQTFPSITLSGMTAHKIVVGQGSSSVTGIGPGNTGQFLVSGGASADPVYTTLISGTPTVGHCVTWASATELEDAGGVCGGTGSAPAGASGQLQANSAGVFGAIGSGTAGQVLISNGASAPSFGTLIVGTPAANDCPSWASATTLQDSGAPCGYSAALGQSVTQGEAPPVAGAAGNQGFSYTQNIAFPYSGYLTSEQIYASAPGTVELFVATISGGNETLVRDFFATVTAGLNTISWQTPVAAGQYLGVFAPGSGTGPFEYTMPTGPSAYYCACLVGTSTPVTLEPNLQIQIGWTIQSGALANIAALQQLIPTPALGAPATQGTYPATAGAGTANAGYTYVLNSPFSQSGTLGAISAYEGTAGNVDFEILAISPATGVATVEATSPVFNLVAGQNTVISWNPPVTAGEYLAEYNAVGAVEYANTGPGAWNYAGLVTSGATLSLTNSQQIQIGWALNSGLFGTVSNLSNSTSGAGIGLLAGADPTGAIDATQAVAAALALSPQSLYIPPTAPYYAVTALPNDCWGCWGPGAIALNGAQISTSAAPTHYARELALRGAMMSQIYTGSVIAIPGDSIVDGFQATSYGEDFVSLFTNFINAGVSVGDQAIFVDFDTTDPAGGPAFEGISFSGPSTVTNGSNGPVGKTVELQPAQSLSFTCACGDVDFTYTGVSSGQVTLAYNGTVYKTINTASSGSDVYSGPSATGQTVSGLYTIKDSGSVAVEITSLERFGFLTGSLPRAIVGRFAHGGYAFASFTSANAASMLRIGTNVGGGSKPLVISDLGTNDEAGNALTYSQMYTAATTFYGYFTALGVPVRSLGAIMPWRWTYYAPGGSYEQGNAGLRDAFGDLGVGTIVQTDGIDFSAFGLVGNNGAHPNNAGEVVINNLLVDGLIQSGGGKGNFIPVFAAAAFTRRRRGSANDNETTRRRAA